MRILLGFLVAALAVACGGTEVVTAADGGRADGGRVVAADGGGDAGANASDGGEPVKDGGGDAGAPDAGAEIDGGTKDDAGANDDGGASSTDGGNVAADAGITVDGGPSGDDGGAVVNDGGAPDGGVVVPLSSATNPATVVQAGTSGILLRGTILAPSMVLDPGEVLVVNGVITCVDVSCATAAGAANATWIETNGVVSPGLIDAHNHIAYNFLPEWVPNPSRLFQNRYQWAADPQYEAFVKPYAAHRSTGTHYCPAAKWGELRSLVHGTTTVQGESYQQSCVNWGVRNADHYHQLGAGVRAVSTNIGSVRDINDLVAQNLLGAFMDGTTTRYAVHMQEGVSGSNVTLEFDSFAGRDTRTNRHMGISLLYDETSILIHSMGLTEAQLQEVVASNAKIVWSPSSNMVLYGQTANIKRILELGIVTGLGPDWTPSGEDELLSEMRYALRYGASHDVPDVTSSRLWQMATSDGAEVVGLAPYIGSIEVGKRGDLVVFGRQGPDAFGVVTDSRAADVRLVLIDGKGWYGDANLQVATSRNALCEAFSACGTSKYLCVEDAAPLLSPRHGETLGDIRTQLFNILEGIGYPDTEQYHRGSELLPLVDCSR